MRNVVTALIAIAVWFSFGCGEKKPAGKKEQPMAEPAKQPAPPPEPVPPPQPPPVERVGKGAMARCPSSVQGSRTEIKDAAGGVDVVITAADADKIKEVQARAGFLAEAAKKDPSAVEHTGEGDGGGGLGGCPVVLKDTTISVANTDGGATITVKPTDAAKLDWLKREATARASRL